MHWNETCENLISNEKNTETEQTELKEKYNFLRMGGSRDGHGVYIEMSMM